MEELPPEGSDSRKIVCFRSPRRGGGGATTGAPRCLSVLTAVPFNFQGEPLCVFCLLPRGAYHSGTNFVPKAAAALPKFWHTGNHEPVRPNRYLQGVVRVVFRLLA